MSLPSRSAISQTSDWISGSSSYPSGERFGDPASARRRGAGSLMKARAAARSTRVRTVMGERLCSIPMAGHDLLLRAAHDADLLLRLAGLLLVPSVLVRRKEPSSTIAWILVLLLVPALGTTLYLLFGRDRVRWPARRKRQLDAVVREQVRDVDPWSREPDRTSHLTVGSTLEQGLFRVAQHLTHLRATSGNRVDVLAHGNDAFDAIGEAIDAARHHVHAQYYLIRDDATGAWFRERLVAAAKRGVRVRLLMDGFGCFGLPRSWRRPL